MIRYRWSGITYLCVCAAVKIINGAKLGILFTSGTKNGRTIYGQDYFSHGISTDNV